MERLNSSHFSATSIKGMKTEIQKRSMERRGFFITITYRIKHRGLVEVRVVGLMTHLLILLRMPCVILISKRSALKYLEMILQIKVQWGLLENWLSLSRKYKLE